MNLRPCLLGAMLSLGVLAGCGTGDPVGFPGRVVPDPVRVPNRAFADTDATYYADATAIATGDARRQAAAALQALLDGHVVIETAWYPEEPTSCRVFGAATVAIVRLVERDDRLLKLGFMARIPDSWVPNCGVANLLEYRFR